MERWKDGRMEGWRDGGDGKVKGGWRDGRMVEGGDGGTEGWKRDGRLKTLCFYEIFTRNFTFFAKKPIVLSTFPL